uniref:Uncharacterized protein n=1 Tax=Oryzias latipes TaxID=8090 RepID=A0A3B3INL7_ORYLA
MFLKLKDIVASDAFRDYITDPRGLISKKDFQKAMDSQKQYSPSEIQFLLSCSEADENDMINYEEFASRYQEPAKDIGFNIAVLLTNLSEHVPHDTRLQNFLGQAESVLNYFRPFLGRIEIMGASRKIERIYFEISEVNRRQWEMPQVRESKRQFIFDVTFLYLCWYLVMSLLGHYNNFFFACHLLDIAMGVKTLRTILSSVTHNGKQASLDRHFSSCLQFQFSDSSSDEPDMKCDDMMTVCTNIFISASSPWKCLIHLAGGGIGDEIEDPAGDEYELYRVVFDITFFFFVIVILLAIIQGKDGTVSLVPYSCEYGEILDYFDTTPHGFETHTFDEHNLANYLFFLMYLINKDETEHTGQESYVWKMYQERCWDFFPAGDSTVESQLSKTLILSKKCSLIFINDQLKCVC